MSWETFSGFLPLFLSHWFGPYGAGALVSVLGVMVALMPKKSLPAQFLEATKEAITENQRAVGVGIIALVMLCAAYMSFCDVYKPEPNVSVSNFSRERLLDRTNLPYKNFIFLMELRTDKEIEDASVEIYSVKDGSGETIDGVHFPLCRYTFGKHSGGCFSKETVVGSQNYPIFSIDAEKKHLSFVTDGDEPEHYPIKDLRPGIYLVELVVRSRSFVNGARFIGELRWTGAVNDLGLVWSKANWPEITTK